MHFVLLDDIADHNSILQSCILSVCSDLHVGDDISISSFCKPDDVLQFALNNKETVAYFLDIDLGSEYNGLDLRQLLLKIDPKSYVIYVSAHEEFALLCCQSHAFDFLRKPIIPDDVQSCLQAIFTDIQHRTSAQRISLQLGSQSIFIDPESVLFARKNQAFCDLYTLDNHFMLRTSLQNLKSQLTTVPLVQIHRNTLVNLKQIASIDWGNNSLSLQNGQTLEISRRYGIRLSKMKIL